MENKLVLITLCFFLFTGCFLGKFNSKPIREEKAMQELLQVFECWKYWQVSTGKVFISKDSCDKFWELENYETSVLLSIPSEEDIYFFYSDLNNDKKKDLMVLFVPRQCDGGNAYSWYQTVKFVLSRKGGYQLTGTWNGAFQMTVYASEEGVVYYDSIGTGKIYATRVKFEGFDAKETPEPIYTNRKYWKNSGAFISRKELIKITEAIKKNKNDFVIYWDKSKNKIRLKEKKTN